MSIGIPHPKHNVIRVYFSLCELTRLNQLIQQILSSKLYTAIEGMVSLDKETVSLDKFKEIAQNA